MQKKPASKSGLFNPRILFSFSLCSIAVLLAALGFGANPSDNFANAVKARTSAEAAPATGVLASLTSVNTTGAPCSLFAGSLGFALEPCAEPVRSGPSPQAQ